MTPFVWTKLYEAKANNVSIETFNLLWIYANDNESDGYINLLCHEVGDVYKIYKDGEFSEVLFQHENIEMVKLAAQIIMREGKL